MSWSTQWLDRILYPSFSDNWDDDLFRERILPSIRPGTELLDLGAGAGLVQAMRFRGIANKVCGIDLDPRVVENPHLDEGRIADAGHIPYGDSVFDLVFADNVMEHLDDPESVFSEIARVTRPGGRILFKTPNKTHYMPLIARCTPHGFHRFINRLRGRDYEDTFPTRYKVNTLSDATCLADRAGLEVVRIERIEGRPEYMRLAWPLSLLGAAYEHLVNSTRLLEWARILLIVELRKPDEASRPCADQLPLSSC